MPSGRGDPWRPRREHGESVTMQGWLALEFGGMTQTVGELIAGLRVDGEGFAAG